VKPAKITCSNAAACSAIARAIAGSPWPCSVTHQLEIASRMRRPSAACSHAPRAATTSTGSGARQCCV
jgi:hypothetical protein